MHPHPQSVLFTGTAFIAFISGLSCIGYMRLPQGQKRPATSGLFRGDFRPEGLLKTTRNQASTLSFFLTCPFGQVA